jgi:hypothetical protein
MGAPSQQSIRGAAIRVAIGPTRVTSASLALGKDPSLRIVHLLREVEQALIDVKINGILTLQEALSTRCHGSAECSLPGAKQNQSTSWNRYKQGMPFPCQPAGACRRVGEQLGINRDTLRGWVKQAQIDAGARPGVSSDDRRRLEELERENRELRRANAI